MTTTNPSPTQRRLARKLAGRYARLAGRFGRQGQVQYMIACADGSVRCAASGYLGVPHRKSRRLERAADAIREALAR